MKTFAEFQEETKVLFDKPKSHGEKVTKKLNKFSATFDLNKSPKFGFKIFGQEFPPKNIEVKRSLTPRTAIDRALEKYKKEQNKIQEALIAGKDRLDPEVLKKYPDLDPLKPRDYMKLKRLQKKLGPKIDLALKTEEAVAPTNNVGGGQIAGTVEAGDDPPVKKKKKKKGKGKTYAYGGRGSRKPWMA